MYGRKNFWPAGRISRHSRQRIPRRAIMAGCPAGGMVLDSFFGACTTGLVADQLQRDCIGIDLNPAYAAMAERRIHDDAGMFANIALSAIEFPKIA
jgi:hypothetical protein